MDIRDVDNNKQVKRSADKQRLVVTLPAAARSSLNRCNLPAVILGSHTYQQYPVPLFIDGVSELHNDFFKAISVIDEATERARHFRQYMCSAFLLGKSEQAGLCDETCVVRREKSDYQRLLRGWMFNPDGIEAAVLKRWVESRFGLNTLNHCGLITAENNQGYQHYHRDYVRGLYNSNALEAQLDLLYTYCQYECKRHFPTQTHLTLYRGINSLNKHNKLGTTAQAEPLLLLNNLSSFSCDREYADAFGDVIFEAQVPSTKLLYFPELLPGVLKGEGEYLVIGGVYQAKVVC